MNQTDVDILKLGEAGRAALAEIERLRSVIPEWQTAVADVIEARALALNAKATYADQASKATVTLGESRRNTAADLLDIMNDIHALDGWDGTEPTSPAQALLTVERAKVANLWGALDLATDMLKDRGADVGQSVDFDRLMVVLAETGAR